MPTPAAPTTPPATPAPRRNYWPYAIIAYFCCAIIFIISYTVFASRQRMDLVRADYYDEEIHFQKQIDRVRRTDPVNAELAVNYNPAQGDIRIQLPVAAGPAATGRVLLYRPADARLDEQHALQPGPDGIQIIDARKLQSGLWKVRVEWTRAGQEYYFDRAIRVGANQG